MSSLPFLSFLIILLLAAAVCTHGREPVTDTDGNEVRIGEQYSFQLANFKSNGGVIPAAMNLNYCALDIIQVKDQPGVPVMLEYALKPISLVPVIVTNRDISITFNITLPVCPNIPMFWRELPGSKITIDGSPQDPMSWFQIEKVGEEEDPNIYKLKSSSGYVGARRNRNGALQLVLAKDKNETILVKFNKVNDATTAVTSTSRTDKLGLRMLPFY